MAFDFTVPTPIGSKTFHIELGTTILFVGANGGGKTRLAVKIEKELGARAHRISAHRALSLNPSVAKISERDAIHGLRIGSIDNRLNLSNRSGQRWKANEAVALLNDFDFLLQALYAEQANTSLETHKRVRAGSISDAPSTNFEKLTAIWSRVLPQRQLEITGDDIQVYGRDSKDKYPATDMSDGERAIFYLVGQTLLADSNSLIIFDEPELHIHRSIMSRLWDELEAERPDCGMVLISHDLDFASSREGQKYVLRDYDPAVGWDIEDVPLETGFAEEVTTLILGSRTPVLFVEGNGQSLDRAIYRACYPGWTIIPRGSCEEVLHAVVTMRANASLTRVACAGIVDADAYNAAEAEILEQRGIKTLPVSEIENIFLLPSVLEAILMAEGYLGADLISKLSSIFDELFTRAAEPKAQSNVVMRYARRRIDRTLKKIDFSDVADVERLATAYADKTAALDVQRIAQLAASNIQKAIADRDVPALLKWFDNKGLLSVAARAKGAPASTFEQWIVRTVQNGTVPALSAAIRAVLPDVSPA